MATRDPATAGLPSSSSSSSSTLASSAAAPQGSRGPQPGSASVAANKAAGNAHNYASTVATQSDVVKYRGKYKELKAKIRDIEAENDEIHLRTLNLKRTIQRMRLERAVLYERLEAAQMVPGAAAPPPRHIRPASPPSSSNVPFAQQQQQQPQQEHFRPPMPRPMAETHAEEDLPRITLANGERVIPSVLAPVSSLRASYATPVGAGGGVQQQQQQQQGAGAGGSNGNGNGNGNGAMKVTLRRGGAQQQQQPATMAEQATATSVAPAPPSVPEQQQQPSIGAGQAGSPSAGAQRPGSGAGAGAGAGSPPS